MAHGKKKSEKNYYVMRMSSMKTERQPIIPRMMKLSAFLNPDRGRFSRLDHRSKAKQENRNNIINNTGSWALRTATAGMHAGVMSPARPWFKFDTPDPQLAQFQPVKLWLQQVELIMRAIFNGSNLYSMAPMMLGELMQFGTSFMTHVDDFEDVARFYTHTMGAYYISNNGRLDVDTAGRELQMTAAQMVRTYGLDKVSQSVKSNWDLGNYDAWHNVNHFIEPNSDSNPDSQQSIRMPFRSVHYEPEELSDRNSGRFLRVSGFRNFPGYAIRWETTGEDAYGSNCPGMVAVGDTRQMQTEEKRKAQGIDKSVNPPLQGPASVQNKPVSSLPGGLTIHSSGGPQEGKIEPIYTVTPNLQDLKEDIKGVEKRIERAFYVDMFLAIMNMEGIQPRNELELAERNGERLLQLGPPLERIHGNFLDPLIDRTFDQAVRAEILPPPPPELSKTPLKIKYISSLAQSQRAVATAGIDRVSQYVTGLSQLPGFENVADKFNADEAVDHYANVLGIPATIIRSDDEVKRIREARAQAQAVQQQAAIAQQTAETVKTTAEAGEKIDDDTETQIQA